MGHARTLFLAASCFSLFPSCDDVSHHLRSIMSDTLRRLRQHFGKSKQPQATIIAKPDHSVSSRSVSESAVVASGRQSPPVTGNYFDVSREANPLLAEAKTRYNESITTFDKAFTIYASKNQNVKKLDSQEIAEATPSPLYDDTSQPGKEVGKMVQRILQSIETDKPQLGAQVCAVVSKLFPLMKLALGVTENVADVIPRAH